MRKYISEVSVSGTTDPVASAEQDGVLIWLAGWWNHGVHNTAHFLARQRQDSRNEKEVNFTSRIRDVVNSGYETVKQWTK